MLKLCLIIFAKNYWGMSLLQTKEDINELLLSHNLEEITDEQYFELLKTQKLHFKHHSILASEVSEDELVRVANYCLVYEDR